MALLGVAGVDADSLGRAFGNVELNTGSVMPAWMRWLLAAVHHFPVDRHGQSAQEDSVQVASQSFSDAAAALLDWDQLLAQHAFLDERTLMAFARHLATRVVMTCTPILELESTHTADTQWDFTRSAWRERLIGFPGLNFVMGTAVKQWRDNALELIDRLHHDLDELQAKIFQGRPPGVVVDIACDLGDRHHDGRSVSVVTFQSGDSVVYKPKDLHCARVLLDLFRAINTEAESTLLSTFRILLHEGYAWEEYVHQEQIRGRAESRQFFERYGRLLRVLQLVEGRDFWIDNLRVGHGFPVFVDLECILQPRIHGMGFQIRSPGVHASLYDESVIPTAAVTQAMEVDRWGRQDFGGLAGGGPRALPLGLWNGYRDRENGNMILRDGHLFWTPDVAWPVVDDQPAVAADFLADLDRGYRYAHSVIAAGKERWLAFDGPLHDASQLRVRALLRSTWEYLILLRASLSPTALLSGVARETELAAVLATTPAWGDVTRTGERARISWSEATSLRNLDIPQFHSCPSTQDVYDTEGAMLGGIFSGTAIDRLVERLSNIDMFELDAHAEALGIGVRLIGPMAGTP